MIQELSYDQFEELRKTKVAVVDVCEHQEVGKSFPEAIHWPLSSFGLRKDLVSQECPTIFICKTGLASMQAAEIALKWTNQPVYYLLGGYLTALSTEPKPQRVRISEDLAH